MSQYELSLDDVRADVYLFSPRSDREAGLLLYLSGIGLSWMEAARTMYLIRRQNGIIAAAEHGRSHRIDTKRDMYALLESGALGNTAITCSLKEAEGWFTGEVEPDYPLYAIRYKRPDCRQWQCYDIPAENVWPTICDYLSEGAKSDLINVTPMMPDDKIVVQGEVARSATHGWSFRVSRMRRPMRIALGSLDEHHGAGYWTVLKTVMDPSSYDDLQSLFDLYPDATVEFSVYSCHLGNIPHRNTIIWEVRNY